VTCPPVAPFRPTRAYAITLTNPFVCCEKGHTDTAPAFVVTFPNETNLYGPAVASLLLFLKQSFLRQWRGSVTVERRTCDQ